MKRWVVLIITALLLTVGLLPSAGVFAQAYASCVPITPENFDQRQLLQAMSMFGPDSINWSPNSETLAVRSFSEIRFFQAANSFADAGSLTTDELPEEYGSGITDFIFTTNSSVYFSSSGAIARYDLADDSFHLIHAYDPEHNTLFAISTSPQGILAVLRGVQHPTIDLWDIESQQLLSTIELNSHFGDIRFLNSGASLFYFDYTPADGDQFYEVDMSDFTTILRNNHEPFLSDMQISSDDAHLYVLVDDDDRAEIRDIAPSGWRTLNTYGPFYMEDARYLTVSPAGDLLLAFAPEKFGVASDPDTVPAIYDLPFASVSEDDYPTGAFSPDGRFLAMASSALYGEVQVWGVCP